MHSAKMILLEPMYLQDLLTTAHSSSAQGITSLQSLLSTEELELFEAGRVSIDRLVSTP